MEPSKMQQAAAGIAREILAICVNSHKVFFDAFLGHDHNLKYPERESRLLMQEIASYCVFSVSSEIEGLVGAQEREEFAQVLFEIAAPMAYTTTIQTVGQQYLSTSKNISAGKRLLHSIEFGVKRIASIHKGYQSHRDHIRTYLEMLWERMKALVGEAVE